MTDREVLRRPSTSRFAALTTPELVVLRVVVVAFVVLAVLAVARPSTLGLRAPSASDVPVLLAAFVVYALNHALRALRLAVLVHGPLMRLRSVLRLHLLSAAAALLTPFRLGDLVRARLVGVFVASPSRGLVVVWLERALDVAVVIALLLVSRVGSGGAVELWSPLLLLSAGFVVVTVALVTVVPENLHAVSLHLVRRRGPGGLRLLAAIERTLLVLAEAPHVLRRKTLTLVLLTVLIWSAELLTLALVVPALAESPQLLATGLLTLLSELASGAVAVLPGSGGELAADPDTAGAGVLYRFVVVFSLLAAGAVAGAVLLGARARTLGRTTVRTAPVRWTP